MEKISSVIHKVSNFSSNLLLMEPRSDSYHDKLVFYCGTGLAISTLVSLGFKTNMKTSLMLGLGIPMGYLNRDLMNFVLGSTNTTKHEAFTDGIEENNDMKN